MAKDGEKITVELEVVLDLRPALAQIEALKAALLGIEGSSARQEEQAQAQPEIPENDLFRMLAADIAQKLESGEMTINEARKAIGLEPLADPRANDRYQRVTW